MVEHNAYLITWKCLTGVLEIGCIYIQTQQFRNLAKNRDSTKRVGEREKLF